MSVERLKNMKRQVMACMNMTRNLLRELEREIGEQNRREEPIRQIGAYCDEAAAINASEYVIGKLNEQTGRGFDPLADNTVYLIRRLIERGYTAEDMVMVVDFMVEEWREKEQMQLYLRPQTLFGDNFESYLQFAIGHFNKSRFWQRIAEIKREEFICKSEE